MMGPSSCKPGFRILLVEDEDFLRRIFKLRLAAEGYDVTEVGSAEAAWEWLKESVPHLIILDLYLPQMGGFEFLQRLKAHPTLSRVAVLILSGLGQEADIRKGLELGAKEYVIKTKVRPSELLAKISKLLNETVPDPGKEP
jgi:DNA-binding response OmpR family regulator